MTDAWAAMIALRAKEYRDGGMSADDADRRASDDVVRDIKSGQPVRYTLPPAPIFNQPGCVCPPTAEKTCESPTCPRKPFRAGGA